MIMKICLILFFSIANLLAQYSPANNSPDCYFTAILSTVTRSTSYDNRETKCSVWKVQVANLSNASSSFMLENSSNNSTWNKTADTDTAVAATTAGNATYSTNEKYISVIIRNKGTGNVVIAVSGYAYQKDKNSATNATPNNVPMTTLHDPASATVSYYCFSKAIFDALTNTSYGICAIQKITLNATPVMTSVQWADGDADETKVWANRASLTYK